MYRYFTKTRKGQISIEAAIVVPIVLLIVASLIYMSLYSHDIISMRSGAYIIAIDDKDNNSKMPGLFVMSPKIVKKNMGIHTKINIHIDSQGNTNFINKVIHNKKDETLTVQNTMNSDAVYAAIALMDTAKEEKY